MASKYGGQEVGGSKYGGIPAREINKPLQFFQKIAQGATFGFGDEISAAMAGGIASITGGDFKDAYSFALDKIRKDEAAFSEQNPKSAMAGEMLGAITTGGMAGGKVLGGDALKGLSTAGKYGRIAAVGGAEGALYGAGTAEEGERAMGAAKGAATGAVVAPLATAAIESVIRGGKVALSYAARKLGDTPRSEAIRAIRNAALNEGVDADEAVRLLDELGPEATLADLGENFRYLARSATDQGGEFKTAARSLVNARQLGQQDRLLDAAEIAAGHKAGDFGAARQALVSAREAAAKPLYEEAFETGIEKTPELKALLERPAMKSSMAKATKLAADEGQWTGELNLLQKLHYAKMDLDDKIGVAVRAGAKNRVRILTGLKKDLLQQIDDQVPAYKEARNLFSGQSSMIDAMDAGLGMFKSSVDDLKDSVSGMTASEKDLFKLGAVRAIKDKLDTVGETHDATKRLLNTRAVRDKLGLVFENVDNFVKRATAESEFTRTRDVLAGGSPTAERLAGQASLASSIQPELITGITSGDPVAALGALGKILGKKKVTPELVQELSDLMLQTNMPREQVRRIFAAPVIRQKIGAAYDSVVVPAIAGSVAPAQQAISQ